MANLPSQHPHLALHLTDRALTPIISSSSPPPASHSKSFSSAFVASSTSAKHRARPRPTFSTSPPSSDEDDDLSPSEDDDSSDDDDSDEPEAVSQESEQSQALTHLTIAALSSYDTAKRLGKGAPLRTMVEYGGSGSGSSDGPVVLHNYMCPMSLALGTPGRKVSNESLRTGAGGATGTSTGETAKDSGGGGGGGGDSTPTATAGDNNNDGGARTPTDKFSKLAIHSPNSSTDSPSPNGHHQDQDSPNAPPMFIGTVVAPKAEDLRDARRAAGRLERVARVFQTEWVITTTDSAGDGARGPGGRVGT